MPYNSNSQLPSRIRKALPQRAQSIFRKAFNIATQHYSEKRAFEIAWAAVKKKYLKKDGKWTLKSTKVFSSYKRNAKSSDYSEKRFVDLVLSTPSLDDDKEMFHSGFLEAIGFGLKGMKMDLEHVNLKESHPELGFEVPDVSKDWIAKIVDSTYNPNSDILHITTILNETHENYEDVWNLARKNKIGASLEIKYTDEDYFYDETGNRIYVGGTPEGASIVKNPSNEDAQVLRTLEAS